MARSRSLLAGWPNWPIRTKLLVGLGLLVLLVAILSSSGLYATYAYRGFVKSLSARVSELPVAADLYADVSDLRSILRELHGLRDASRLQPGDFGVAQTGGFLSQVWLVRDQFRTHLDEVESTLGRYRRLLEHKLESESTIGDNQAEWQTVAQIDAALARVRKSSEDANWMLNSGRLHQLDAELAVLQTLTAELPSHLHMKLAGFADDVRLQYRAMIIATWVASISAAAVFALFVNLFFHWIITPLKSLISGSRRVASGDFDYRIHLETNDEMAELAGALNDMTERFQAIRDDLDRQVQERTKQVVRSEQLASVGFLAAGVAHEINNPLASIAMCAESLEGRIDETFGAPPEEGDDPYGVVRQYLRMIQNEAFRCKEITERLLDFARVGPVRRQPTELGELVQGVIDMVGHIGKYQRKSIDFSRGEPVTALVNPQEIKQVVLNLLINALDSLGDEGTVRVSLRRFGGQAELIVADDGCGMDAHVLQHIFEPFFTRRRTGQGTGLGLSISYRIVSDHGGEIESESGGAGCGSTFRVRLPLESQRLKPPSACAA
ncbi:MAG: ATP-binding protein [Planctomycetota bacterium]